MMFSNHFEAGHVIGFLNMLVEEFLNALIYDKTTPPLNPPSIQFLGKIPLEVFLK